MEILKKIPLIFLWVSIISKMGENELLFLKLWDLTKIQSDYDKWFRIIYLSTFEINDLSFVNDLL